MRGRTFGRLGWRVGEVGIGTFGMGWWSGADEQSSRDSLQAAMDLGCTFFDTAWEYGEGLSERLLGGVLAANSGRRVFVATKIPPKTMVWPSHRGDPLEESFPPDHIREYVHKSLENLRLDSVDLIQFHAWEDDWADDERWQRTMEDLKREGLVRGVGISLNRWEPWNSLRTIRTGLIDSVQVVYNIFDQAPEDELFPLCRELGIAVIARVPLDEGGLTGTLTRSTSFPEDDWRTTYFTPRNLAATIGRADALQALLPEGMTLPEMALRFVLSNPDVSVVIPGMRSPARVRANLAVSDRGPLAPELIGELRAHRWDRSGPEWAVEASA
jgi:aryl-alcohol dehydrogenase-like predicted oxidoreductase